MHVSMYFLHLVLTFTPPPPPPIIDKGLLNILTSLLSGSPSVSSSSSCEGCWREERVNGCSEKEGERVNGCSEKEGERVNGCSQGGGESEWLQ